MHIILYFGIFILGLPLFDMEFSEVSWGRL